jgi:hypothetical protein
MGQTASAFRPPQQTIARGNVLKCTACTQRGAPMKKPKHAGGRPTLYRREMCERLVEAMANGLTAEAVAARIGISARSLFYWHQQHPEFLQAIQEGRQRSQLWWEERVLAMACVESGNTQMVRVGLRNRSHAATGWNNDTVKLEHSGAEGESARGRERTQDRHRVPEPQAPTVISGGPLYELVLCLSADVRRPDAPHLHLPPHWLFLHSGGT